MRLLVLLSGIVACATAGCVTGGGANGGLIGFSAGAPTAAGGGDSKKGASVQVTVKQPILAMQPQTVETLTFAQAIRIPSGTRLSASLTIDQPPSPNPVDRVTFLLMQLRQQQPLRCAALTFNVHGRVTAPKTAPLIASLAGPCPGGKNDPAALEPGDLVFKPGDALTIWLQPEDGDLPTGATVALNLQDFRFEVGAQ